HIPPYWKYAVDLQFPKFGPVPPPCLSCPQPWEQPVPDGFDRSFVGLTPFLRENAPLGPGRAGDIKVSIAGGGCIGPVYDAGGRTYMQLVQHRHGEEARVSASVGNVSSTEVVAGRTMGVSSIYRTLTYVLGVLLVIAIAAIGAARRPQTLRG